ncbi:MAG: CHAD domain-containing protein [Verrucomicrobia bacterium]|nr:CHAD domain-containing protein [Verrucomicrobiota bacterium]
MKPAKSSADELSKARFAARLLWNQFHLWRRNEAGAIAGKTSEPLHQLRVAIRRFRAVLRLFRKTLAPTSAAKLDRALDRLNASLGPARDADVWLDCLQSGAIRRKLAKRRRWPAFLRNQLRRQRQRKADARRILRGRDCTALRARVELFLRSELPRPVPSKTAALKRFAAGKVGKAFYRAVAAEAKARSGSPEKTHRARILVRRARYAAEFCAPLLGPVAKKLARRLRSVADEMGCVRDLDLQLGTLCATKPPPPSSLRRELKRRRRAHRRASRKAWRRLTQPRFGRQAMDRLAAVGGP